MTRQKKEIIKKIDAKERFINADMEMGCGFAPEGFYDAIYSEIYELEEELAELRHYGSRLEMFNDDRTFWRAADMAELPFV